MSVSLMRSALSRSAVALLLGCAAGADSSPQAAAGSPNTVTVSATDYAFEAPDTVPAGLTTIRLVNRSEQMHMAMIARLDEGRTVREFVDAYGAAVRTQSPRPAWATWRGGPAAEPHGESSTTQRLEPGQYLWICVMTTSEGAAHVDEGMVRGFVVTGDESSAASQAALEPDLAIRLLEYAFDLSGPLTAGRHVIRVENAGVETHNIGLLKIAPGYTPEDLQAWQPNSEGPRPFSFAGTIAALSPGTEAFIEVDITPGDYFLVCLVDGPSGVQHTDLGMIQHVHVAP